MIFLDAFEKFLIKTMSSSIFILMYFTVCLKILKNIVSGQYLGLLKTYTILVHLDQRSVLGTVLQSPVIIL